MTESKHLVVISCEGWYYHEWQAQVAVYSCLRWQGVPPVVMVHGAEPGGLTPGFLACRDAGACVIPLPNYRGSGASEWAPRNTVASLLHAIPVAEEFGATHIVIVDPDMVWTRKVSWPTVLAVDACENELHLDLGLVFCERLGVDPNGADRIWGSRVPYVIPLSLARQIGEEWARILELFCTEPDRTWSDQMRAWSLALATLNLPPHRLRLSQTNWQPEALVRAPLIHYAYAYSKWDKRWFTEPGDEATLWDPERIPVRYVQGWVHREVVQARAFYDALAQEEAVA